MERNRRAQLTLHDALTSQDHDSSKSNAEGGILPKTEERETGGGLESPFLVLGKNLIVLLCLILLIVKILHHNIVSNRSLPKS